MNDGMSPDAGNHPSVILIGADGSIGSRAAAHLRAAGWAVIPTVFRRPPNPGEIVLDVTRRENFEKLPGYIPVVNSAGIPDQSAPAALMRRVHVGGMANLTAWARQAGTPHIVHISSIAVYGGAVTGTGRTEAATRRRTRNPLLSPLAYGRTKARAERMLERSGLPYSALRLPAVYGPGDAFFSPQIRRLLNRPEPLPPGGARPVSIIPVDHIGGLLDAVLRHGPMNASLNAAGTHAPWSEILETYAAAWGLPLEFARRRRLRDFLDFSDPGMQMAAWYGSLGAEFPDDVLRNKLNWNPGEDWKEAVRRAAAAFGENEEETCASCT